MARPQDTAGYETADLTALSSRPIRLPVHGAKMIVAIVLQGLQLS